MRNLLALLALVFAGATLAAPALAQEEEEERPGAVAFSEWKCPFADLEEAVDRVNTFARPIFDELTEEGMILGFGVLTHWYADEWNLILYTLGDDPVNLIEANAEYFERLQERTTEADRDRFLELCPEHRDNIYAFRYPGEDGM